MTSPRNAEAPINMDDINMLADSLRGKQNFCPILTDTTNPAEQGGELSTYDLFISLFKTFLLLVGSFNKILIPSKIQKKALKSKCPVK